MHRPHRWLAAALALGLLASGCSRDGQTIDAGQAPLKFGDAFGFDPSTEVHPGPRIESIAEIDYSFSSAILGSVVTLEPDVYIDPAELDGLQTVEEYAAKHILAVVRVDEVLHGSPPIEGEGGLIRVGLPGELTVSLADANAAALAANPMILVAVDNGPVGDGRYLATIFVRDGPTFSTPFSSNERFSELIKAGMGISTFDELLAAFRDL